MRIYNNRFGYTRVETDDEVLNRLRQSPVWKSMGPRSESETFDQWLERYGQSRKMIYVP